MKVKIKYLILLIILTSCGQISTEQGVKYRTSGVGEAEYIENGSVMNTFTLDYGSTTELKLAQKDLEAQNLSKSIKWEDSRKLNRISRKEGETQEMIYLKTSLKVDSFFHIEKQNAINKYAFFASTSTTGMKIIEGRDSIQFQIRGTFKDTIIVEHRKKNRAEKVAINAVNTTILTRIKENIISASNKSDSTPYSKR